LHYTIYGLKQSPRAYYLLCQKVYTEIGQHFMVEIPKSARVYPSCRHAIAILIVVMYVDNNGLRTNAKRRKDCMVYFQQNKKRRKPRVKSVTLNPCGERKSIVFLFFCFQLSD